MPFHQFLITLVIALVVAAISFFLGITVRKRVAEKEISSAEEEARRRERAGAGRWREDWRRELRRRFNPQNFYLTEAGLAYFWPMYAIAPASEGVPVFVLPYGEGMSPERKQPS